MDGRHYRRETPGFHLTTNAQQRHPLSHRKRRSSGLSAALGGGSRAQLGYLIARSGILDNRTADPADPAD